MPTIAPRASGFQPGASFAVPKWQNGKAVRVGLQQFEFTFNRFGFRFTQVTNPQATCRARRHPTKRRRSQLVLDQLDNTKAPAGSRAGGSPAKHTRIAPLVPIISASFSVE